MNSVSWTEQAVDDLTSIQSYISKDSQRYAKLVVGNIYQAVEETREFPEASGFVDNYEPLNIRQKFIYKYRVIYRFIPDEKHIDVLAIQHGSQKKSINIDNL